MKTLFTRLLALCLLALPPAARAWDYEGHRLVNQLALASLPTNFPAFLFTAAARERIAFLAGEPDRWRNAPDLTLKHYNGPDHYIDFEDLEPAGLKPATLPPLRYVFNAQYAAARARQPDKFPPVDAAKDADQTKALPGFLPWAITEYAGKLKSAFSYLRELEKGGTAEEVANAQANIIYMMGVMGHYVGDGAQPLHTTRHFNGWVGENPNRYTTSKSFHTWIDGGFINKAGVKQKELFARVRPARLLTGEGTGITSTNLFPVVVGYLEKQHAQMEPLYRLDRDGKLSGRDPIPPEGYAFITGQFLEGGQMLGDLWLTAWHHAGPDNYLRGQLARRKLGRNAGEEAELKPDAKPKTD